MKVEIGNATLYLGNCEEILPTLGQFDAVVTDPPYKLNDTSGSMTNSSKKESWQGFIKAGDKNASIEQTDWNDWVNLLPLKNPSHLFIFCNDKNLVKAINAFNLPLHNILVWKKDNCTPNRWFMKNGEFILFLHKGKSVPIKDLGSKTVNEFKSVLGKNKQHPTQKPVELMEFLIKNALGNTVLDPFMGSGTTGVACMNLKKKFVGIEKEKKYFDIACKRIEDAQRQVCLF